MRRGWITIVVIVVAAAGGWIVWAHLRARMLPQYVHPVYNAEQVLHASPVARQPSPSPSSVMRFIRSAESNRCRLRTLHAQVKTHRVFYPAYISYKREQRAILRTLEKRENPSEGTRPDAIRTDKPLVDQSTAEWWIDVEERRVRVKRLSASYQAKLSSGAFGDVVEAGCGTERLTKVYGTGYIGYAHRVVVSPPKKEAIEVLFLECDSDWLLLLTMHYQPPLLLPGKPSSFWEYVFGECRNSGRKINTLFTSTVQGTITTLWGERCYVVSMEPIGTPANERLWLWFSVPKDLICVRAAWEHGDRIQVWSADKWQRVNGIWLPTSGKFEEYFSLARASRSRVSSGYVLARETSFTIEPLSVNTPLPDELFAIPLPSSAWVDDHFRNRLYGYGKPLTTKSPSRVLAAGGLGGILLLCYVAWKMRYRRRSSQ